MYIYIYTYYDSNFPGPSNHSVDRQKCYPEISDFITPQITAALESWNDNESSLSTKSKHNEHTVGGRNPGPPGMYKALVNNGIFKSYSNWLEKFRDPSSVWFSWPKFCRKISTTQEGQSIIIHECRSIGSHATWLASCDSRWRTWQTCGSSVVFLVHVWYGNLKGSLMGFL